MTTENKLKEPIDEDEVNDAPIVDSQTVMIISYWSGAGLIVFLWCLGVYFFTKLTLLLSFIALAIWIAEWFDEKTLKEAGVKLGHE
jgi:hypothetical protein